MPSPEPPTDSEGPALAATVDRLSRRVKSLGWPLLEADRLVAWLEAQPDGWLDGIDERRAESLVMLVGNYKESRTALGGGGGENPDET